MRLWTFLMLAAACCLLQSCDEEEDCSLNARPMMNCNILAINEETGHYEQAAINQLTITAFGTDSVIVNRETNVKSLSLPLCYTADSTHLVLHYSDGKQDQVIIRHSNTPYFLSMECGYQMKQQIESVSYTRTVLDSIALTYNEAGIYGRENLKLYY
ncbi:MAG: DUF6452 family protein [Bacteroides sp.]